VAHALVHPVFALLRIPAIRVLPGPYCFRSYRDARVSERYCRSTLRPPGIEVSSFVEPYLGQSDVAPHLPLGQSSRRSCPWVVDATIPERIIPGSYENPRFLGYLDLEYDFVHVLQITAALAERQRSVVSQLLDDSGTSRRTLFSESVALNLPRVVLA
jgi:hypothetical protein